MPPTPAVSRPSPSSCPWLLRADARLCRRIGRLGIWIVLGIVLAACSSSRPYTLGPVKTEDPDRRPIEEPRDVEQNFYWDRVDLTVFYQAKKPLNLAWTGRRIGSILSLAPAHPPADNVNVLDEPPASSWWMPRDYYAPMSPRELAVGPNLNGTVDAGPDTTETWTIWRGKSVGAASGFFIEDARGDRYLLKFDRPDYPELASSAEVISTKILYAAGYHVPQNTIAHFHPDQVEIGDDATVQDGNSRRPMRPEDVDAVIEGQPRRGDGKIRVMASRFVDGDVLGPWNFRGRRDDDPNDQVRHQDRRELRGLRVISAWLNDTDRRAANTLAVYTDSQYVKHYVQDMSSTLGANTGAPHRPIHGQAYMIDPRIIPRALISLGAYPFDWWSYDPTPMYRSVGYWRSDVYRPADWVPTYPNPAFERMTDRDAFWGAKIVMGFSNQDLEAIVETAHLSDPAAEGYLLKILKERRDKTGRYWFARMAPLDRFRVEARSGERARRSVSDSGSGPADSPTGNRFELHFNDLATIGNLTTEDSTRYRFRLIHEGSTLQQGTVERPVVPLQGEDQSIDSWLTRNDHRSAQERVVRLDLWWEGPWRTMDPVRVYVAVPREARQDQSEDARTSSVRVVGVERP